MLIAQPLSAMALSNFPLDLVLLPLILQLPDVAAEPGAVLVVGVPDISVMLVPSFLKTTSSQSSVMLRT